MCSGNATRLDDVSTDLPQVFFLQFFPRILTRLIGLIVSLS